MKKRLTLLATFLLLAGCAGALTPRDKGDLADRPEELYAVHLKETQSGTIKGTEDSGEIAKIRASIVEARKNWQSEVSTETEKFSFYDFSSPSLEKERTRLRGESYSTTFRGSFSEDEAVVAAYFHNPGLAAAKEMWRAKLDRLDEATRLDLVLREYGAFARDLKLRAGKPIGKEMVGMAYPAPGMLALAGDTVDREIRIARENYRIKARDLVRDVRHSVADLAYVDTAMSVTHEVLSLVKAFEEVIRVRYEGGGARQGSILRAQVELSKLENKILTLEEMRKTAGARLASLLGLGASAVIGTPKQTSLPDLPGDAGAVKKIALDHRQELRRQGLMVEKMTIMVELAETMTFPMHTLGLSLFERGMGTKEGSNRMMPPFRAKPRVDPKAWYAVTQAHLDEIRDLLEAAKRKQENLETRMYFAVQRDYSALDTALRLEALYGKSLVAKANQAYEAAHAGYRVGRAGFNDVTDAQRMLLKFRLEWAAARRDALKSWADLSREVGAELR